MARVLVAETDWTCAEGLRAVIEAEGHDVYLARNGLEASDMALTLRPDLILLAENLPIYSARELCRMFRGDPALPSGLPLLVLAGPDTDRHGLCADGASGFLPRQASHQELRDLLVRQLGEKAATP